MQIEGLVLTGNVLLVAGSDTVVAWLLTEEGWWMACVGGRRAGRSDSIWSSVGGSSLPNCQNGTCLVYCLAGN
jgi:hypothetical protein